MMKVDLKAAFTVERMVDLLVAWMVEMWVGNLVELRAD